VFMNVAQLLQGQPFWSLELNYVAPLRFHHRSPRPDVWKEAIELYNRSLVLARRNGP